MDESLLVTAPGALGECLHTKFMEHYGMASEPMAQDRVLRVASNLQRTRLPANRFQVELLRLDMETAFTAPGPYVYISHALVQRLVTDDALTFVVAHEMAHHELGHIAVYQRRLEMLGPLPGSSALAIMLTVAERVLFSPERELEADAHGLKHCLNLGYEGSLCLETFDVLEAVALKRQDVAMAYGPEAAQNIASEGVERWIATMNTWVWQRARGYPSIRERKERLQALLTGDSRRILNGTGALFRAPTRLPSKMTLDQIDQALEEWRAKLLVATDNLLALDDNLTYKRLQGKDGLPTIQLSGITRKRVSPALEAVEELFQHIGLLTRVVERATELRKSVSRFRPSDSTIREIEQLLYGPSIPLPSDQTPLAQRSLLSAAETTNTITPERLLAVMTEAFEEARNAVFAVEAAWAKMETALGKRASELSTLQRLAATAGAEGLPELAAAQQKAAALHTQIESDPLGASTNFDTELAPLLQSVRARLGQIAQQREQVVTGMAKAREVLTQLEETHRQCVAALQECQEKVGTVAGLRAPLDSARIAELTQWLGTLETTWQEGRWQPAGVGLERWLQTASEYLAAEKAALAANNAPVETRAELRGRLAALKVKAQTRGLAQDASLDAIAKEAEQLLHQHPLPLDRVAQLVSDYDTQLSIRIKR